MSKTIGLKQLAQKIYTHVELSERFKDMAGDIEDAFDCIIYGESGNGKSNFISMFLKELLMAIKCKCEYVAYEEGHAKTIQDMLIHRHNFLEELGNVVQITDHYAFDELYAKMKRRKSAKIWVIDSVQEACFTTEQCTRLKRDFVLSKKKKILIYISWAEGKTPKGSVAKAIEYRSNIKLRIEGYIVFPKSRYGGNKPFVSWDGDGDKTKGAKGYWGDEFYAKSIGLKSAKKIKPKAPVKVRLVEVGEPKTKTAAV